MPRVSEAQRILCVEDSPSFGPGVLTVRDGARMSSPYHLLLLSNEIPDRRARAKWKKFPLERADGDECHEFPLICCIRSIQWR